MKKVKLLVVIITIIGYNVTAQVGISSDGSNPNTAAMLDVKSTTKGFLPPRMTESERDAISSPVAGLIVYCTDCIEMQMYNGTAWVNIDGSVATSPPTPEVYNPSTGETWMDRNLGASRVATSSNDVDAYGFLYQWGRATEGHEVSSSGTISTTATTAVPNVGNTWDGLFIAVGSNPYDWLTTQDNTLWQGTSGTNNPCPSGFRLPTEAEWDAERQSWTSNNASGAYSSPLKLTVVGYRSVLDGLNPLVGSRGYYWASTINGTDSTQLNFRVSDASMNSSPRGYGFSVRCIKD